MAYFPNGTSGMIYEERYCYRCKNRRDKGDGRGAGCAIWDAHLLYSYEECNNDGKTYTVDGVTKTNPPLSNAKAMLDMLIPEDDGFPAECSMFLEKSDEELEADRAAASSAMMTVENPGDESSVMPCMRKWAKQRRIIA